MVKSFFTSTALMRFDTLRSIRCSVKKVSNLSTRCEPSANTNTSARSSLAARRRENTSISLGSSPNGFSGRMCRE